MRSKVLLLILALSLVCAWGQVSAAGQIGYKLRSMETGFGPQPQPALPSSGVMAADAVIGRPLGLATTIAGTAAFLVTLPMSLGSDSAAEAAWGLVGQPAGWTFKRPLGRDAPEYEERGFFQP